MCDDRPVPPGTFPNPERDWARAAHLDVLDRDEVERRLGPIREPLAVLSGGQANLTIRVGADRVLRIYRRDRGALAKEHALLRRGWASFAVPAVLDAGDDFLLLEYVPHGPLGVSAAHAAQVGRALAEIHRTRFHTSGFLAVAAGSGGGEFGAIRPELEVSAPFGDVADAIRDHARSELARATWLDEALRCAIDDRLSASADLIRREAASAVLLHGDFKASNLHWTSDDRLLVLDWEFAYAGPALMDIGQLLRWHAGREFIVAFADSYRQHGGPLSDDWERAASIFDLVNLAGLAADAAPGSSRADDLRRRLEQSARGH